MKIKEKRSIHKEEGTEEIIKYDENGSEIYYKGWYGEIWSKYEYDEKGNEIYFEDTNGNVRETRYDENGHIVYSRDDDKEFFYEYDEEGNKIIYEDAEKTQRVAMYDKYRNLIYSKIDGKETWNTYNEFGNVIKERSKDIEGNEDEVLCEYEYDEAGRVISFKDSKGNFARFDTHGNPLYSKNNYDEFVYEYKYDDKGNIINEKRFLNKEMIVECWAEYDAYGNQTLHKNTNFGETIITYIYYPE